MTSVDKVYLLFAAKSNTNFLEVVENSGILGMMQGDYFIVLEKSLLLEKKIANNFFHGVIMRPCLQYMSHFPMCLDLHFLVVSRSHPEYNIFPGKNRTVGRNLKFFPHQSQRLILV